ncbi:hypothetical protein BS47DRAFT_355332 [Hydnum rufescens UP504]|uniref:Uncharacterized protein n=1 Tax=Hydnum rufescens UP504 TaxID=1448309 RepID=A0A9P6DQ59_9AGAM|nr:hypothetical protein BS47DRAFT_355332 [Hydnum rufescens UP504]
MLQTSSVKISLLGCPIAWGLYMFLKAVRLRLEPLAKEENLWRLAGMPHLILACHALIQPSLRSSNRIGRRKKWRPQKLVALEAERGPASGGGAEANMLPHRQAGLQTPAIFVKVTSDGTTTTQVRPFPDEKCFEVRTCHADCLLAFFFLQQWIHIGLGSCRRQVTPAEISGLGLYCYRPMDRTRTPIGPYRTSVALARQT